MKRLFLALPALLFVFLLSCNKREGSPRVLVFGKTAGFHHNSIPAGFAAIQKLGLQNNFRVDTTTDASYFNDDSLKNYAAVVFVSTTGKVFDAAQEASMERYIQAGGGFVGIHAASDIGNEWGWFTRMVGALFLSHPAQQDATLLVVDKTHPSTQHLPDKWVRKDEWYNFQKINPDLKVLIKIDEKSYEGGKNGDNHPMAWYHEYDGGRAWYTELGHTDESYSDSLYLGHLLGGIQYAIDGNKTLDYSKAKTQLPPAEDRFVKTVLTQGTLTEPTELTVLPSLDILVSQRRGEIMLYKNDTKQVKQAALLNVYWKSGIEGVNAEEGVLGIKADPNFKKNNWVYIFYSPMDTSVNRLSRFEFKNDTIDLKSEKVILQFYSQRGICCHTGGSIAFGPDGTLFVSAGDNSTPFDEPKQKFVNHGFAPLNDAPGHTQYDARRSAGNTNDLRGKIIRIKPNDDGTYSIPDGNLFAKGTANTKPEIYVMGNRNPYRISVDPKNGFLYWGEVGPDAGNDSMDTRGPRGYDEVNQARKAGFFGWPLFVGNNYPYHVYDYTTGVSGPAFDPAKPRNESKNNTGLQDLPPAQPAFIWYPYAATGDFPSVGTGGRNAMAGPVYYADLYPAETRMPDYYNGKLFIYEWIRGWVKAVTMLPNGDLDRTEPFMASTKLNSLIDMEMGPDGKLYYLEYGNGWFTKNPEAGISRIDFIAGNRAPKVAHLQSDRQTGALPFAVKLKIDAVDPEKDKLTYTWDLGDGNKKETTEPSLDYSYAKAGDYNISVDVKDDKGAAAKSETISVYAGNETPVVDIKLSGNQMFYFPGQKVQYVASVVDKDDPNASNDASGFNVIADYVEGGDKAAVPLGHLAGSASLPGKNLMLSLDCKSCHQEKEKSVGPAFVMVANKYAKDPKAIGYLVDKIKKGGGGVWGETAMAAHPTVPDADLAQIATWILSLSGNAEVGKSLPVSGTLDPTMGKPAKDNGNLYLTASYTDKGGNGVKPLTGRKSIVLASPNVLFNHVKNTKEYGVYNMNGTNLMIPPKGEGWFSLDSLDLTGVKSATLVIGYQGGVEYGYHFEVRLDAADGKKVAEGNLGPQPKSKNPINMTAVPFKLDLPNDGKPHSLFIVSKGNSDKEAANLGLFSLKLSDK